MLLFLVGITAYPFFVVIWQKDWIKAFGLAGWLVISFIFSLFLRLTIFGSFERFTFPWDAPLWIFFMSLTGALILFTIRERFRLLYPNTKSVATDFVVLVALIPVLALINAGIVVSLETFVFQKTNNLFDWTMKLLLQLIVMSIVGLSCIAYFYFSMVNEVKQKLARLQMLQAENQLMLLRKNIDPHFLFNNLNALSSLIEKNPADATKFLNKFSELYHYILDTQEKDLVPIRDEIEFTRKYVYLIEKRFEDAYEIIWKVDEDTIIDKMIVPTALQSLIENAVKHNSGSRKKPLEIRVGTNEGKLFVENESRKKLKKIPTHGSGLDNLLQRYDLLTGEKVEVIESEEKFRVEIPLVELKK